MSNYEVTLINSREGNNYFDCSYKVLATNAQKAISNAFNQLKLELGRHPAIEDVRCIEL